jgi:hypothetical protein
LRVGWRWRQYANPAGKHESRDQDSDHGVVHPSAAGFRYAAPTALQAASALPPQRTKTCQSSTSGTIVSVAAPIGLPVSMGMQTEGP